MSTCVNAHLQPPLRTHACLLNAQHVHLPSCRAEGTMSTHHREHQKLSEERP